MLRLDFNLVLTIINLIVLYLLLRKFLIRPLTDIMEKRKAMIENGIKNANDTQAKALELKSQYEGALKGARDESNQIIEQARNDARVEYERIVKDADTQAGKVLKAARETMEVEREQTLRDMKSQVAELAIYAAKKIITDQSSESSNQAIYDQFLEEAGESHDDTDNH